jgi:hypothetical protein
MPEEKQPLPAGPLLLAEFNYIAQTAFQANEDRARVTSFYLVTFGSFVAALLSAQTELAAMEVVRWGFAVLFLGLAGLGLSTIRQLALLRRAWFSSVQAMNQIKEHYLAQDESLKTTITWTNETLPARFKTNSVAFTMTLEVALVASIAVGASVYFVLSALGVQEWYLPVFLTAALSLFAQVDHYRQLVNK